MKQRDTKMNIKQYFKTEIRNTHTNLKVKEKTSKNLS